MSNKMVLRGVEYELEEVNPLLPCLIPPFVTIKGKDNKEQYFFYKEVSKQSDSRDWEVVRWEYDGYLYTNPKVIAGLPHAKIFSVKRLSDGEVFSVGDKVDSGFDKEWSIGGFQISSDTMYVLFDPKENHKYTVYGESGLWRKCKLSDLKKVDKPAKPLFVTEDGVEIFKGDSYVKLNTYSDWSIVVGFISEGCQDCYGGLKFSTKEKAEEYRLLNKPLLSLSDLLSVWGKDEVGYWGDKEQYKEARLYKKFEQLAKDKLSGKK